jgi:hypothetical protein
MVTIRTMIPMALSPIRGLEVIAGFGERQQQHEAGNPDSEHREQHSSDSFAVGRESTDRARRVRRDAFAES